MSTMSIIVTWVQDVNGDYEVSSAEHFKQIMHKGTLYTDAGTPPAEYWGTDLDIVSYIQTADIDFLNDSTDIHPIGSYNGAGVGPFYGSFNGANFTISNWSYVDAEFATSSSCESNVGLFGTWGLSAQTCFFKNIRMAGIWSAQGFRYYAGLLLGSDRLSYKNQILNIEIDLDSGSQMIAKAGDVPQFVGGVVGYLRAGSAIGITLKGNLDLSQTNGIYVGGIFGGCSTNDPYETSLIQNLATFPSGIIAIDYVGGITGYDVSSHSITKLLNAMNGGLYSSKGAGGIIGYAAIRGVGHTLINAMTGHITNSGSDGTGGMIGKASLTVPCQYLMNYMTGNISIIGGGTNNSGGIIGSLIGSGAELSNSINAMNGSVDYSVVGSTNTVNVVATVDTSFGLTFTVDNFSTSLPPAGLITNSGFPELPYATLDGTDSDGNSYDFDFVFANLTGNSSYSSFTHLVLHRGDVDTPFSIDFDVPETNTALYLTFINGNTMTFVQSNLSIALAPGTFSVTPRSINIIVNIGSVSGATGYRITYESTTAGEVIASSGSTSTSYNIVNLVPETQYTIRMYTNTGYGYVLSGDEVVSTLTNISTNYDVTDFQENGVFDISAFNNSGRGDLSGFLGDLFNTGDLVKVTSTITSDLDASFIKLGETLSIKETNGVLIPFDQTSGSGQNVTVTLSDNVTNVPIVFDETTNSVIVNSSVYSVGSNFILDGKKVKIIGY